MHAVLAADRERQFPPAYFVLFVLGLIANMFSGHAQELHLPIGPDRLCMAGALTLLVADRRAWLVDRLRCTGTHVAMGALVALACWSASASGTLTTSLGFYALVDRLILPFLLFALAPVIFPDAGRRDILLRALVTVGLYLGLVAIFQKIGPHALVFPRYILDPHVGLQFDRARGPFTESVANGVVLTICGFASAFGAARFDGVWRWMGAVSAGACGLGVLLTLTRSVWIGASLGLVLAVLVSGPARRLLPLVLVGGGLAVVLAFALVPDLQSSAGSRAGSQLPVWDRQNTDTAALRIIEQRPLSGVGWLRFIDTGSAFVQQADKYPITAVHLEVHNVVLARGAELGLPGAVLLLLCMVGGPLRAALRRPEEGDMHGWRFVLVGGGSCWFVAAMLSPLAQPMPNFLIWIMSGLLLRQLLVQPIPAPEAERSPQRSPAPLGNQWRI